MKSHENYVALESNFYNHTTSENARAGLLYLLSIGDFRYEPGYYLRRNSFDSFLVGVIVRGSMTFEFEGKVYHARQGNVILFDCYKSHCYYTDKGCDLLWLHLDGISARTYYNLIARSNGLVYETRNFKKIQKGIMEIYHLFHELQQANDLHIAQMLTSVLTEMAEPPELQGNVRNNLELMDSVICYINEHLDEDLTTEKLAEIASFCKYHFIRVFKEIIGMTPRQYIISARMQYAKYLLKTTEFSVQEIGYLVGYKSDSMFCNTFKKSVGSTPSEFRNKETG